MSGIKYVFPLIQTSKIIVNQVVIGETPGGSNIPLGGEYSWKINNVKKMKLDGAGLDMNNLKIVNLATPTENTDVANKAYVDGVVSGLDTKESVNTATTVNLNSNTSISGSITYNNIGGISGRGQITTTLDVSNTFTVDGVTYGSAQNGTRILLKNQTSGAQNGIWTITISGSALTLDRATDFDTDSEVTANAYMRVETGTDNADTGWTLITNDPITIGGVSGTVLAFTEFAGVPRIFESSNDTSSSTTSTSFIQKVKLTFTAESADYMIEWYAEVNSSSSITRVKVQIQQDDTIILASTDHNPDDSAAIGYGPVSGFTKVSLTANSHDFDIDFASSDTQTVNIRRARIKATKII